MKTAFLIKSLPRAINFHCDPFRGISFTTSYLDVTYLNNVVVDGNLRIFTEQKIHQQGMGKPAIWFLIFVDKSLSNECFEDAWKYANQFGAMLCRYTQLGLSFSYRDAWAFPQIPDDWEISQTMIQFKADGGFEGIYWDDPSQPIYYENGTPLRHLTMKTINADIITVIEHPAHLSQSHFTHFTIPGMNTNIDLSPFGQKADVLDEITKDGFYIGSESQNYILQLYNRAVTQEDMFVSYTVLFQIVEVLIGFAKPTKIDPNATALLRKFVNSDPCLKPFAERISNSIGMVKEETSEELLKLGIAELLGEAASMKLDFANFTKWRGLRGKLTHPKETAAISQNDFFDTYQSLRKFCVDLITEIHS
jgi:hypothetical protein